MFYPEASHLSILTLTNFYRASRIPEGENDSDTFRAAISSFLRVGTKMLAFISVEPSSLAPKLYAVQELIAALVLVAILWPS